MKRLLLFTATTLLIISVACTKEEKTETNGNKPKISVNLDNKKGEIEIASAIFYVKQDNINLLLADYPLDPAKGIADEENRAKADGQNKIEILMFDLEGGDKTRLEPSVFTREMENSSKSSKPLVNAILYYYKDGSEKNEVLPDSNKFPAKVSLTSFTDDTVSGEIDIQDEGGKFIKGKFTAKIVKL